MPSEAYVVTAAERERCLAALAGVLFTAVETPAVEGVQWGNSRSSRFSYFSSDSRRSKIFFDKIVPSMVAKTPANTVFKNE